MKLPTLERAPVVLAAPSGAGKTTLAHRLVEGGGFAFSVSATTRPPRGQEVEGRDYFFVTRERFREMLRAGELAEWAEVHGDLYGTPLRSLAEASRGGRHVILDIDVQGARQIREAVPQALLLFILPPSLEVLLQRLTGRRTEGKAAIRRRLSTALRELVAAEDFDHFVMNDELDRAAEEVRTLVRTGAPPVSGPSASLDDIRLLREGVRALLAAEDAGSGGEAKAEDD